MSFNDIDLQIYVFKNASLRYAQCVAATTSRLMLSLFLARVDVLDLLSSSVSSPDLFAFSLPLLRCFHCYASLLLRFVSLVRHIMPPFRPTSIKLRFITDNASPLHRHMISITVLPPHTISEHTIIRCLAFIWAWVFSTVMRFNHILKFKLVHLLRISYPHPLLYFIGI
ncbi:hypothetical protein Rs2_40702 [Raphanus sativus]|nr:hypothetical protein Rs2_40702 [Raphanus sativus]